MVWSIMPGITYHLLIIINHQSSFLAVKSNRAETRFKQTVAKFDYEISLKYLLYWLPVRLLL